MTAPNIAHQSGHARAFIEHSPFNMTNALFVMHEGLMVTFEQGGMILRERPSEGMCLDSKFAMVEWTDILEDPIIDIFRAIGKALEIYSDEPERAYKQGYAEGQTAIMREWNESLRADS